MKTTVTEAVWWEANSGEWTFEPKDDNPGSFGALNVLDPAHIATLRQRRETLIAAVENVEDNDWVTGGEGENIAFENGMFVITHNYMEEQQAIVHPDELIKLIDWRLAIMESPDFKNPDAKFDPIEIEYQELDRDD